VVVVVVGCSVWLVFAVKSRFDLAAPNRTAILAKGIGGGKNGGGAR
jgi:hypothetical protein